MTDALVANGSDKVGAVRNDSAVIDATSSAMVTVILSNISCRLREMFPECEYQINHGIKVTKLSKAIIGIFCGIVKSRSDDFACSIGDGQINLKLNKTVLKKDAVITWIRLQEMVDNYALLLSTPQILEENDFIQKLIG